MDYKKYASLVSGSLTNQSSPPIVTASDPDPHQPLLLETARTLRQSEISQQNSPEVTRRRLVDADFKYPLLVVEEQFTIDQKSGREKLNHSFTFVADHFIVRLHENSSVDELEKINDLFGARILRPLALPRAYLVQIVKPDINSVEKAVRDYTKQAAVIAYAEPDYIAFTTQVFPNDISFGELYGLHNTGQSGGTADADIDAPEAWTIATGAHHIVVGVIDTGIDTDHPDLAANIWINPGEIQGDNIDNDNNGFIDDIHGWDFYGDDSDPSDDNSHGTHVSGTIAAVGNNATGVVGVCWQATLVALKFLGAGGSGTHSDAADALMYAAALKRNGIATVRLTSNSWGGGGPSQVLEDSISENEMEDILFVAAAGNDASDNDAQPHHPSSYTNNSVISVASTDRNDLLSGFSNYGAISVDLGAPGSSIYSTVPNNGYGNKSGTSMATPQVAGVIALMYSVAPGATVSEIKDALFDGTDPIPALTGKCVTGGRLNAHKAILNLGMRVRDSIPSAGDVVTMPTTNITITFTYPYDPASLDPEDCVLNGMPSDSVSVLDPATASFSFTNSPVTNQGIQLIHVPSGAVFRDGVAESNRSYTAEFLYDIVPMTVTATVPAAESAVELPFINVILQFNESIDPSSVSPADISIGQGTVTNAVLLDPTSVIYQLSGIDEEGPISLILQKGALKDLHGNPSVSFDTVFTGDFTSWEFPTPLSALPPAGARAFSGLQSGYISIGDVDDFTINAPAGTLISAIISPAATLRPSISIDLSPSGISTTFTAQMVGEIAVVQSVAVPTNGNVTIQVTGADGSEGNYELRVYANAEREVEDVGLGNNDSPLNAQSLDDAMQQTGAAQQRRALVVGKLVSAGLTNILTENFEAGFSGSWTTYTSTVSGRTTISTNAVAYDGVRFLRMDNTNPSVTNLNEAIWRVNLSGLNQANLRFRHAQWNDELQIWTTLRFNGHRQADAISISDKGGVWHQIWSPPVRQPVGEWQTYTVDLLTNAAAARMKSEPELLIKFQQWDNETFPNDGTGFDALEILAPQIANDWFSFEAHTGDVISVHLTPHHPAWLNVEIYDASNRLIAPGIAVGNGRDLAISEFRVYESGRHYVRVSAGGTIDYSLLISRDTSFAIEDGSQQDGHDITLSGHAFGNLGNEGTLYAYEAPGSYVGSILRLNPENLDVLDYWSAPYHEDAVYGAFVGELSFDNNALWFTAGSGSNGWQKIFNVDTESGNVIDSFDVNLPTVITGLGNLGGELFVGTQQHAIYVYNQLTKTLNRTLPDNLPGWLTGLEGSGLRTSVFASAKADTLYRLNPVSGAILQQYFVNPRPDGVEISLGIAGPEVFVGNWGGDDDVLVFNGDSMLVTRRLSWDGEPLAGLGGIHGGPPADEFLLNVIVGDHLHLQTSTPGTTNIVSAVPGSPLDPIISLIGPGNQVIGSNNNGAGDGRNALFMHTALTSGVYRVLVSGATNTTGDYALHAAGASGGPIITSITLLLPSDAIIECGSTNSPEATGSAVAFSSCSGIVTVHHEDQYVAGACGDASTIQRTWIAEDICGNVTSAIQIIEQVDTEPPVVTAPSDAIVSWGSPLGTNDLGFATSFDACSGNLPVSHIEEIAGSETNHTITIMRSWFATDACGNTGYESQLITITNVLPPIMSEEPAVTLGEENTIAWISPVPADGFEAMAATDNNFFDNVNTVITSGFQVTYSGLLDSTVYYYRSRSSLTTESVVLYTDWAEPIASLQLHPDGDYDYDGMDNRSEMVAKTNPLDNQSLFEFIDMTESNGMIQIIWRGGTNVDQVLEHAPFVTESFWQPEETNSSLAITNSVITPFVVSPVSIFRLRIEP